MRAQVDKIWVSDKSYMDKSGIHFITPLYVASIPPITIRNAIDGESLFPNLKSCDNNRGREGKFRNGHVALIGDSQSAILTDLN